MCEGRGQRRKRKEEKEKRLKGRKSQVLPPPLLTSCFLKTESRVRLLMRRNQMVQVSLSKYLLHLPNSCLAFFPFVFHSDSLSISLSILPSSPLSPLSPPSCHLSLFNLQFFNTCTQVGECRGPI